MQLGVNGNVALVTVCGPLLGGNATVSGAVSSQFLSGLLLALPRSCGDSEISVTESCSRLYVRMILDTLAKFGIQI